MREVQGMWLYPDRRALSPEMLKNIAGPNFYLLKWHLL